MLISHFRSCKIVCQLSYLQALILIALIEATDGQAKQSAAF